MTAENFRELRSANPDLDTQWRHRRRQFVWRCAAKESGAIGAGSLGPPPAKRSKHDKLDVA
eukprot:13094206-Alexandrium_andersonii.AAC.1